MSILDEYFDVCSDYSELLEWWNSRKYPLSSCPQLTPLIIYAPLVCVSVCPPSLAGVRRLFLSRYCHEHVTVNIDLSDYDRLAFTHKGTSLTFKIPFNVEHIDITLLTLYLDKT